MKKKLLMTFGPVIVAALLFIGCLALPANNSPKVIRNASQSMNVNVLSGEHLKNTAMKDDEYVPFFGSSELNRFDPFHPSVLATKYHRNYRPFLLGSAGTQSLKQYMIMTSMQDEMSQRKRKKAIFIISPQWFIKGGVRQEYFSHWYSGVQMYHWLYQMTKKDHYTTGDLHFARRVQHFDIIKQNTDVMRYVKKIGDNEPLTASDKQSIERSYNNLMYEDRLYGRLGLTAKNWNRVVKNTKPLPAVYNYQKLDKLAYKIGKKGTSNNNLQIANSFYNSRLRTVMKTMKDKDKGLSYIQSSEYADFQLVLDEFNRTKTDVLFIIPPVNERWIKYTGLSQPMLNQFAAKVTKQLRAQGFNNVVNMVDDHESYFMTDTIHIGWRGWLKCDQYIRPFLESAYTKPDYKMNDYYYSTEWQNYQPKENPKKTDKVKAQHKKEEHKEIHKK